MDTVFGGGEKGAFDVGTEGFGAILWVSLGAGVA